MVISRYVYHGNLILLDQFKMDKLIISIDDNYYSFASDDSPSISGNQLPPRDCGYTFVSRCLPIPCCKLEVGQKGNMFYVLIWDAYRSPLQ